VNLSTLDPTMVVISRDSDGRWFATFAVDVDQPALPAPSGREVGVDLGIKDFAVLSTGERIPNRRHLERKARNLARYQRRLTRCKEGSANRRKAKAKVAAAHRKVRNTRQDLLHKTSAALIRSADLVAIEDLAVKNMIRNRRLAKAISDCGWGEFRRQLEYKAARAGRTLVVIDRWYPSSKTCSACGHLLADLKLNVRTWTCPTCRTLHDRDVNAAKNILAAGRAVAGRKPGDACGAGVRRQGSSLPQSALKQETSGVTQGIPVF
jgi:putative transposase